MAKLFILVGIPGTGKSTWAARHHHGDVIVSSDAIREELSGDATDQSINKEVFEIFHGRIRMGLMYDKDVVADSTALDGFAREKLVELARLWNAEPHLIVFSDEHEALERNRKRDRVVPEEAMKKMLHKYTVFRLYLDRESDQYESITQIRSLV
jgi:protein phosphatase